MICILVELAVIPGMIANPFSHKVERGYIVPALAEDSGEVIPEDDYRALDQ